MFATGLRPLSAPPPPSRSQEFLAAGADIIETNTFNATGIALADLGLPDVARRLNKVALG